MKAILSVVIVAAVTGLVGARYYFAGPSRPNFRTMPVTRGDVEVKFTATGLVEPVETVDVGADRRQHQGVGARPGPAGQEAGLLLAREGRIGAGTA